MTGENARRNAQKLGHARVSLGTRKIVDGRKRAHFSHTSAGKEILAQESLDPSNVQVKLKKVIHKLVFNRSYFSVAVKEMAIKTGLGQGAEKVKGDVFATITDTRGTTCKTSFLRNDIGGDRNKPGKLDYYMNNNTLGTCFQVSISRQQN